MWLSKWLGLDELIQAEVDNVTKGFKEALLAMEVQQRLDTDSILAAVASLKKPELKREVRDMRVPIIRDWDAVQQEALKEFEEN